MLDISPTVLKRAVEAEYLQCYYRRGKNDYRSMKRVPPRESGITLRSRLSAALLTCFRFQRFPGS